MIDKSKQRKEFLANLDDHIEKFKEACGTSLCVGDPLPGLSRVGAIGRNLVRGIQDLIDHADTPREN